MKNNVEPFKRLVYNMKVGSDGFKSHGRIIVM